MTAKITNISLQRASAALSAETWNSLSQGSTKEVFCVVTVNLQAELLCSGGDKPSDDLRAGETEIVGTILERLNSYDNLLRERDQLKRELHAMQDAMRR